MESFIQNAVNAAEHFVEQEAPKVEAVVNQVEVAIKALTQKGHMVSVVEQDAESFLMDAVDNVTLLVQSAKVQQIIAEAKQIAGVVEALFQEGKGVLVRLGL